MTNIVILAAGKGTRMYSDLPKVLHKLAGKAFLQHVIDTSEHIQASKINVVVGHGAELVKTAMTSKIIEFVEQREQLGTGHAVAQALVNIEAQDEVLILYGDVPLIKAETLKALLSLVSDHSMALLTHNLEDPKGYGRIIRDARNTIQAIVEQKDATPEQCLIKEINTGVMAVKGKDLLRWLPALSSENAQGEYYLTDIIAMAAADGIDIKSHQAKDPLEIVGVNNRRQQAELERQYQVSQANVLMDQGLSLMDPARFDLRGSLEHGKDCLIDVNCVFEGKNRIGNNVTIEQNCRLINANIGDNTLIASNSIVEDSKVGESCTIGPYARLRPGSELANQAKIGNFVETKKAIIGEGSKVNHLSYVGDAELGSNVNVGAGTITCNYDGVNKSKTIIGNDAFIGSNSALVAPVTIGETATVAAGSVVTKNSEPGQLTIARAKQRNLDGWQRPTKK